MHEFGHSSRRSGRSLPFASVVLLLSIVLSVVQLMVQAAVAGAPGLRECAAGSCAIWTEPLPEQFTVTAEFAWQPREVGDGIWAVGLSRSEDGPPTAAALALVVEQPFSWFGPMATVKIISDDGALGELATSVEPLDASDPAKVRQIFETGASTLLRSGETYVATLSMDRATGAASVRLATQAGTEVVSGTFRISPLPGVVYAGTGGFSRTQPAGGKEGVRLPELRGSRANEGFERIGTPLALRGRTVLLNVVDQSGSEVRSPVVHADAALVAQVFGATERVPGVYSLYARPEGAECAELWSGLPRNDVEPIWVELAGLRPGRYQLSLAYVEPGLELELASMAFDVIAATVEAYIREADRGVDADGTAAAEAGGAPGRGGASGQAVARGQAGAQAAEPAGAKGGVYAGEIVLRADRDLADLYIEVTAHPSGMSGTRGRGTGATGETDLTATEATGAPNAALLWSGHVSLKANETMTIPVAWPIAPPFEYEITHAYPERIVLAQAGKRIPSDHPFLLVRQDQYDELRRRASMQPWSDMKREAENVVARQAYLENADIRTRALALRDIISAATLLYVIDPAGRQRNLAVLDGAFDRLPGISRYRAADPASWDANVPVASALFSAILALDVVYYDLDPDRRREVEATIDRLVGENHEESWTLSAYALRGTWALFGGDRTSFERYRDLYKSVLYGALTGDGIFNEGTGYAVARFSNPDREQKHLFMDVLEFTGEDSFYGDPLIGRFYEWLFGHALAPDGRPFTFGDTSAVASIFDDPAGAALYRAHRFSEAAGGYAAWWAGRMRRPGSFAAYVLADRVPTPARPAASLIAPDGGAWFVHVGGSGNAAGRGKDGQGNATGQARDGDGDAAGQGGDGQGPGAQGLDWLAGAIWNPKSSGGHSHKDVNAVHLAAYGEHLVVNSGYRGWNQGGSGFTWSYLHDRAVSSNTVLIDGADHRLKHGAGIQAGFIAERLMYARGDSGNALAGGTHVRDFLFVPPADGTGGYWVLVDRADAGGSIAVALHPYSSSYRQTSPAEYEWTVGGARVTLFLATPPANVQLLDGLIAGFGRSMVGKYLLAEYTAERGQGAKQALTVIFPHDAAHPKAELERISGEGFAAARIKQAGVQDLALEAAGTLPAVAVDGLELAARVALARLRDSELDFYFVADGTAFRESRTGIGFASDKPVALLVDGSRGWICSPGAVVTFYGPDVHGVLLGPDPDEGADGAPSGEAARMPLAAEAGPGWVRVHVPEGTFSFKLLKQPDIIGW